jgi:Type II CAAX prenyl endopeptidase Rce1-like
MLDRGSSDSANCRCAMFTRIGLVGVPAHAALAVTARPAGPRSTRRMCGLPRSSDGACGSGASPATLPQLGKTIVLDGKVNCCRRDATGVRGTLARAPVANSRKPAIARTAALGLPARRTAKCWLGVPKLPRNALWLQELRPCRHVAGNRCAVQFARVYLFAFLMWLLSKAGIDAGRSRLVVVFAAVVFALVHLAQPGVSWLQLACITSTGTLYGWIRWRSGSAAPAALSHAAYNLSLYAISGAVLLGEKASR